MAGLAALRAGAGKVYVCGPSFPECPLELISVKRDLGQVDELLDQLDAVVAGPGLGRGRLFSRKKPGPMTPPLYP